MLGIFSVVISVIKGSNSIGCWSIVVVIVAGNDFPISVPVVYSVSDVVSSFWVLDSQKVVASYFFDVHFEVSATFLVVVSILLSSVIFGRREVSLYLVVSVITFIILQKYWHLNFYFGLTLLLVVLDITSMSSIPFIASGIFCFVLQGWAQLHLFGPQLERFLV